jgi:hypothetical protein
MIRLNVDRFAAIASAAKQLNAVSATGWRNCNKMFESLTGDGRCCN